MNIKNYKIGDHIPKITKHIIYNRNYAASILNEIIYFFINKSMLYYIRNE